MLDTKRCWTLTMMMMITIRVVEARTRGQPTMRQNHVAYKMPKFPAWLVGSWLVSLAHFVVVPARSVH